MKSKKEFKEKLNDTEFLKLFAGVKSAEDVAEIAKNLGYDVTPDDVANAPLSDDMLEVVAGGKAGQQAPVEPAPKLLIHKPNYGEVLPICPCNDPTDSAKDLD